MADVLELGDVQETLLIPLYMRALESQRADAICHDLKAVEIVSNLDIDFRRFDSWILQLDVAIRTEIFDEAVLDFRQRHPNACFVNLGAGLDARFQRMDNGQILWFDLDMPDSIFLRRRFFNEGPRNYFIPKSVTDLSWLDDVESLRSDRPTMLIAEGLFCYLDGDDIRRVLCTVADRWPGTEIVFQSISPEFINRQKDVEAVKATKAVFKWGITSGKEVERWRSDFHFLDEWAFIDRHFRRWGLTGWAARFLPWVYRRLRNVMKITHLRLGEPPNAPLAPPSDTAATPRNSL